MLKVVGASWLQTRISTYILVTVALLGLGVIIFGEFGRVENDGTYSATVTWNYRGGYRIEFWGQGNDLKILPKCAARAYYRTRIHESGWSFVEIETTTTYPDTVQAYAAGLLEGSLTWQLVHHHWYNTIATACVNQEEKCDMIRKELAENAEVIRERAEVLAPEDPFWYMVHLFYIQMEGLEAGWRFSVRRSRKTVDIPHEDFLWLAMASDISNIGSLERPTSSRGFDVKAGGIFLKQMDPQIAPFLAVIHNTAAPYTKMLRLLKKYTFGYHISPVKNAPRVPTRSIVSSSYPGALSSQDEYYILYGQKKQDVILVTGTPLKTINNSIKEINKEEKMTSDKPESHIVMSSARIMSANWLASDGLTWSRFASRRDGPENISRPVQWVIVRAIDSTVWLVEQHPRMTHAIDYTKMFNSAGSLVLQGFPMFKEKEKNVFTITTPEPSLNKLPETTEHKEYSKKKPVRALVSNNVEEMEGKSHGNAAISSEKIQSNQNLKSKLIKNAPGLKQITAFRGDFGKIPIPFGVIDTKVSLINTNGLDTFEATCGPDQSDNQEPFVWSKTFPHTPHIGQPDKFDFETVKPHWVWF